MSNPGGTMRAKTGHSRNPRSFLHGLIGGKKEKEKDKDRDKDKDKDKGKDISSAMLEALVMPSLYRIVPVREIADSNAATPAAEAFPDPINETATCSKGRRTG
ncbi:hypothetical protein K449DRAFT_428164 [Hypoxylon sp. EC38]|nr:hypothetical protein K449DRAFT_428164 [Hypoxylon sp. EC38]